MENGGAPKKYLAGILILENGMEAEFLISQQEGAALGRHTANRVRLLKKMGFHIEYNLADQLVVEVLMPYLKQIAEEAEETPAGSAAGESR